MHETRSKFCFVDSKFVTRNMFSSPTRNFFYLYPPVRNQNNRVWAGGEKADIWPIATRWPSPSRLLAEREKFAQHVMVSAGVCFGGNVRLHFVDESTKMDSAYYVGRLLPSLVDCTRLSPSGYIIQQDGAPAHTARATQNWLQTNCPDFIASGLQIYPP